MVPDWSSSFDSRDYGNDFIHANHMNICRFVDRKDDGYLKFNGVLEAYIHEVNEKQQKLQGYRQSGQSPLGTWSDSPLTLMSSNTNTF